MTVAERKAPTLYTGVVASKSGDKSARVVMSYLVKHPKYGKMLKRRTVAHVHDEKNDASVGDQVEICKCRPVSKSKNWRLVRVISRSSL